MMRILLIFFCAFIVNFSFAQSKREISKYNIKSATVTVEEPNQKGELSKRTDRILEWDKKGNLTREFEYSKDGKVKKGVERKYNSSGDITEEKNYDEKGNLDEKIVSSYDRLNQKAEEIIYNGKDEIKGIIKFEYNGFGELISETATDKNGNLLTKSFYKYDNKGLRTERKTINNKDEIISIRTYNYQF